MTVIAYRDGVMAADRMVWQGDLRIANGATKINRLPDGSLVGCCGSRPVIAEVMAWLNGGEKPARELKDGDFGALIVRPCGRVERLEDEMLIYPACPADFYTMGSHGELLFGAMAAGASAPEAVRIAIRFGQYAGGDVQVERL